MPPAWWAVVAHFFCNMQARIAALPRMPWATSSPTCTTETQVWRIRCARARSCCWSAASCGKRACRLTGRNVLRDRDRACTTTYLSASFAALAELMCMWFGHVRLHVQKRRPRDQKRPPCVTEEGILQTGDHVQAHGHQCRMENLPELPLHRHHWRRRLPARAPSYDATASRSQRRLEDRYHCTCGGSSPIWKLTARTRRAVRLANESSSLLCSSVVCVHGRCCDSRHSVILDTDH